MIELILVRHGAVADGGLAYGCRHDPPLSRVGRAEVERLADRLHASHAIEPTPPPSGTDPLVIASPAVRSQQTLGTLGLTADHVDPGWSERDLGDAEGAPWAQLWATAPPQVAVDPAAYVRWTPPGGESVLDLQRRVLRTLATTVEAATVAGADRVVVATHAGPIAMVLGHVLELGDVALTRWQLPTASISTVRRYDADAWTIRGVGA